MKKILWLCPPNFSGGLSHLLKRYISNAGINMTTIKFVELTTAKHFKKKTKTKWVVDISLQDKFFADLEKHKFDMIVVNDKASLYYLTNKYQSLALCRGGIYYYKETIPVFVFDDIRKVKTTRYGGWVAIQDLGKLKRWQNGAQRNEPKFSYTVCSTVADVEQLYKEIQISILAAIDIETTGTTISCIGYSLLSPDGKIKTFVLPFYNTLKHNGAHWETEAEEITVWSLVRKIHQTSTWKVMQNGSYDSTYFVVYGVPLKNYLFDTLHIWHSIWAELPKKLDFLSSIALDFYRYWKDEVKEDADDSKSYAVPMTVQGLQSYWLYNAMDCNNTLMVCKFLVALLPRLNWALSNYEKEFTRQFGCCFSMSMRGTKVNQTIHQQLMLQQWFNHESNFERLKVMVDSPMFNPKSPKQVQELLYDILGAKEIPRKKQSTNETELKLIATQDPLLDIIINQIWKTKKPANNVSKYSDGCIKNSRFMYKLYTATTPTERLSSKGHDLWVGSNIQNVPKAMRVMYEPDDGYVLVDADYSQSDAYFTAYESADPRFIATMESGKDTHCIHASQFFKCDYDVIYEATQNEEDWAVHPTKGVRQITKRVVYGSNYFMAAFTLFMTMGKESVIAAAQFLGFADADTWDYTKLVKFCETHLLDVYYQMYPNIKLTIVEEAMKAARNGNRASAAFGYTRIFFGNIVGDQKAQREFAAFFGQGGTAGNINLALENIFWELEPKGVMLLFQVHDSIIFQVPKNKLYLIPEVLKAMENTVHVKGRNFVVPAEAKVGLGWGKRMMPWNENITLADIEANEQTWQMKWQEQQQKLQRRTGDGN